MGGYMQSLEYRYGDPRVYEAQREAMAVQQAEVMYAQAKTHEDALTAAYYKNRSNAQTSHKTRLAQLAQDRSPRSVNAGASTDQKPGPPGRGRSARSKSTRVHPTEDAHETDDSLSRPPDAAPP